VDLTSVVVAVVVLSFQTFQHTHLHMEEEHLLAFLLEHIMLLWVATQQFHLME
jgi:hypothetical protein